MAITLTWDEVIAMAPELAVVDTIAQEEVLTRVLYEVEAAAWPDDTIRKTAAKLYARHLGTTALPKSGMGNGLVRSISAGGVSKSFAISEDSGNTNTLHATKYGLDYLVMCRAYLPQPGFVL